MPFALRPFILASLLFVLVLLVALAIPSGARAPMLLGITLSLSVAFAKTIRR